MATANNMTITNNASDSMEEEEIYTPPKATLYFSHSEAVLPFLSLLGLNKDDYALTHDNYEEAKERCVILIKKKVSKTCINFYLHFQKI